MHGSVLDVCSGQLNTSNLSLFLELLFYLQPHRCSLDLPCPMLSYEASPINHALCACSYLDHCPYCSRLLRLPLFPLWRCTPLVTALRGGDRQISSLVQAEHSKDTAELLLCAVSSTGLWLLQSRRNDMCILAIILP